MERDYPKCIVIKLTPEGELILKSESYKIDLLSVVVYYGNLSLKSKIKFLQRIKKRQHNKKLYSYFLEDLLYIIYPVLFKHPYLSAR